MLVQGLVDGHPYSVSYSNLGSELVPQAMPMHIVTGGLEPAPRRIADEAFRLGGVMSYLFSSVQTMTLFSTSVEPGLGCAVSSVASG